MDEHFVRPNSFLPTTADVTKNYVFAFLYLSTPTRTRELPYLRQVRAPQYASLPPVNIEALMNACTAPGRWTFPISRDSAECLSSRVHSIILWDSIYDQIFLLEPITYNNSWTGSVLSTTTSPADNVLFSLHLIDMGTEMYGDSILCQFGDTTILTDGRHSSDFQGQKGFMSEVLGVNLLP
jgi:hypothetical protein